MFFLFSFAVSLLQLSIRKKGTLIGMGVLGNVANNRCQFPKLRVTFKRGYRRDIGLCGDILGLEFPKIRGAIAI